MATITNIKYTASGIYATAQRGGDQFKVTLSSKLPRWDALNSGSYIAIPDAEWQALRDQAAAGAA